jgi:hypothetical protein
VGQGGAEVYVRLLLATALALGKLVLAARTARRSRPISLATHPSQALLGPRARKSGVRPPNTAHRHMPCAVPPRSPACRANPGGGGILVHRQRQWARSMRSGGAAVGKATVTRGSAACGTHPTAMVVNGCRTPKKAERNGTSPLEGCTQRAPPSRVWRCRRGDASLRGVPPPPSRPWRSCAPPPCGTLVVACPRAYRVALHA